MSKRLLAPALALCFLLLGHIGLQAQLSPYYDFLHLYEEAVELFDKSKYGAAQKRIDAFLEHEEDLRAQGGDNLAANDLHAHARYIQALSAYHLDRNDAVSLLEAFVREFADNSLAPEVQYYLGKYHFGRRAYRDAILPLERAYNQGRMPREQLDETIFLLAYCYYMEENDLQALRYFGLVSRTDNPYREDALYYRSVIHYQNEDYPEAYEAFQELTDSDKYGREIRVYLANTMLKMQKYDELYVLAEELISAPPSRDRNESQIYYIVANASFEREDYPRTTEFYDRYTKARGRMNRTDYFRHGYAFYQQQDYQEAIPVLQRALTGDDTLTQIASYYLGFCFLEEDDPASAKFAFQKAAEADGAINPVVQEDALYQYAKVSFATESYDEALKALNQLSERYPQAAYIDEVRAMTGEIYLYTRDYARSIQYLESIPRTTARTQKAYQTVCYFYGLELYERPDYDQAIALFRKAIDNNYDQEVTLGAQYWTGEAAFRKGDFAQSRQAYQAYLRMPGAANNEYYSRGYYGLAWAYFKEKKYSESQKAFADFLKNGGSSAPKGIQVDANLRAGDCLFIQKNYGAAANYYQTVLNLRYTYRDYATYQLAEGKYRQNRYQESVQTFAQLISGYADSELRDNALDRISEIYATWIKDYGNAAKYARMLVDDYPRSPLAADAYNRLALATYNLGNTDAAITYFKKVLTDYAGDRRNAQIALDNLSSLLPGDEFDRVLADYRNRNPEMDNNLAGLVFSTGKDRFFSGNYRAAIEQFSTYIRDYKNGPDYFEVLVFRARAYKETGDLAKALADYETVHNTTVNNAFTNVALLEAAQIKYEQQDFLGSLLLYQELEQTAGRLENRVQAWFGIADNYLALKDYEPAENAFMRIADNAEVQVFSRTKARVGIGNCQYLRGQLDQARTTFAAVERDYKNLFGAESQYMLTRILFDEAKDLQQRGLTEEAKASFEAVKQATLYMKNNYPTFNYWKARTFLVAAMAYYELGNAFQAKGTLESLIAEERFPDIQAEAQAKLNEILAAESQGGN
ncbi:MAG: hypothetical protein D6722_27375 [Bacteroidetes bacterium]|nr:MAG: hypothetical protein D6722_27375 [Bacteroidota bacterium]